MCLVEYAITLQGSCAGIQHHRKNQSEYMAIIHIGLIFNMELTCFSRLLLHNK